MLCFKSVVIRRVYRSDKIGAGLITPCRIRCARARRGNSLKASRIPRLYWYSWVMSQEVFGRIA